MPKINKSLPNSPTHNRLGLSTHPLVRNFIIEKHKIDPKDFRCDNNSSIEVFKSILDTADLFGCYILDLYVSDISKRVISQEMIECIIQKLKASPQFEVRLNITNFNYFKLVFNECYHPEQLLITVNQEGRLNVYTCKFNHAFNAATTSTTQSATVTAQRPIAPLRQQALPPRSIPRTTPEVSRVAQKPPSPMREPARVLPQVNRIPNSSHVSQITQMPIASVQPKSAIPRNVDISKLIHEQKERLEIFLSALREGQASLAFEGKVYLPIKLYREYSVRPTVLKKNDNSEEYIQPICVSDQDFEQLLEIWANAAINKGLV